LGLSTVYGIVEQSRGVINVESRLGEGTVFHIYLPRAEGRPAAAVAARSRRAPSARSARVLLVEDEPAARRALEEFLREDGHTVISAGTGADAERLWGESGAEIDVVLTDTVMPRMSGPELVQRLRTLNPDVKVIFMSGHTPETVLRHGAVAGADFLQKPFEIDDLLRKVRAMVGREKRPGGASRQPGP
jgi:DNA-binding NtrC family response regulator